MSQADHIGAQEAAKILRVSARMVYRYGEEGKLRTIRAGRRILFNHDDVLALADETAADSRPPPQTSIVSEEDVGELRRELLAAARQIGRLEGLLEQRPLLTDLDTLKDRVHTLERENDKLRFDLERERAKQPANPEPPAKPPRPWWRKLLG